MRREIKGQIHNVSSDFKMISIQIVDKLEFFYLQPRFVKQFRKYLYPGVFVVFNCDAKKFKMRRRLISRVIAFEKIIGNRYHRKFSYFDHKISRQNILNKIKEYEYLLFLDLEMTLERSKYENEEIVQVGAILVDEENQEVFRYNEFIQPTSLPRITGRTTDFLNIERSKIEDGILYNSFYDTFKTILLRYKPAVIVWGNNDKYALSHSYNINRVSPIFITDDFINLQQVLKQYYNFNNELGLFTTAKIYQIDVGDQAHDAYEDAQITRLIFNKFYDIAYNDLEFNFTKAVSR